MRRLAGVAIASAAFALAGCGAQPQAPAPSVPSAAPKPAAAAPGIALRNGDFEADMLPGRRCAPGWDCTMHNNPESFRFFLQDIAVEGRRSFCIERVVDEPWALATQGFDHRAVRGARVRLSMAVLVQGVTGEGAGAWALVQGNPPINPRRLVRGSATWQRLDVDFNVPPTATVIEVGVTLEGPGKACFDDVRLEVVPPA